MARKRLVDADRFVAALDADAVQLAPGKSWRRAFERAFGGHDRRAEIFISAFEPRRHIHGVAHHRIVEALARADIADQCVAGINADALTQGKTLPFGRLGIELVQTIAAAQGGVDRALRMVRIVDRRAEYRNDGVADIFVDEAALLLDDVAHRREIFVYEVHQVGRGERLGNRREAGEIGKENGDVAHFAAQRRRLIGGDHFLDHAGREIKREAPAQEAPVLVGDQNPGNRSSPQG